MVHNVLFDPPLPEGQRINVGNNIIIENIDSIYNLAIFKNFFKIYLGFLLAQYILIYICVPLDDIENRPAICIISTAYTLIMFVINALVLPLCSGTIPTVLSLRCLFTSFLLEFIGLVLNVVAVVQCLRAGEMFEIEKERGKIVLKTRVDKYINFFQITSLVFAVLATVCVLILLIICEKALEYIANKVDRRVVKRNKEMNVTPESIEEHRYKQDRYYSLNG
ncbi:hypothetical protein Cantr_06809 [Candida viswanathii]|uniref:MARVEL domain-containing protein n=1 Tax=Candida viswanathii TaxID=5486 RepID=A0A367XYA9_9ASCO|nr:hypothetical protein Cantr_06809 [Candida viswanathii]